MANSQTMAALTAAFNKSKEDNQEGFAGNNYYPFWNMKFDETAIVRFLPDAAAENPLMFMREKLMHTLIVGTDRHSIPCFKMYGDTSCPICKVSASFYKIAEAAEKRGDGVEHEANKALGKKYYRKKQYLAQALIVKDPLPANEAGETHAGKVRYLSMSFQLHEVMKNAFKRGDLEDLPYDFANGTNFIIMKTKQGEHATYTSSGFERRPSSLDEATIDSLEIVDLGTLLPQKADLARVEQLLAQSLDPSLQVATEDAEHDDAELPTVKTTVSPDAKVSAPKVAAPAPVKPVVAAAAETKSVEASAAAILEKIRARQAASKAA